MPESIPFESTPLYPSLAGFQANAHFDLPFWRPAPGTSVSEIAILTNGFLEGVESTEKQRNTARKRYDLIAKELVKQGFAAVFLPLPFHFERGNDITADGRFAPLERLRESGSYLYFGGYDQAVADIKKLVDEIRSQPKRFGLEALKRIHLVGYSLGGAAALGASASLGDKLASVTTLCSTWGIARIKPEVIERTFGAKYHFGKAEWKDAMEQLEVQKESFDPVFRDLAWGDSSGDWISGCPNRMLFIHGLSDKIFPPHMTLTANWSVYENVKRMNRETSTEVKREIVFMAFMTDHLFMRERKQVAGYVASFITNPVNRGKQPSQA